MFMHYLKDIFETIEFLVVTSLGADDTLWVHQLL